MFGSTIEFSDDVRRPMALLAVAAFCSVLSACTLRGPTFTPVSHAAYNEAVQEGEQREVLLNIVRLRYLDRPEFLAITSISSQMHFEAQASLMGSFGDDQDFGTSLMSRERPSPIRSRPQSYFHRKRTRSSFAGWLRPLGSAASTY
jgi:hypothetical protein